MPASAPPAPPALGAPWLPDLGDGRYRNPVLFADYSDPDAIRVGDDYWLTASSFCHVPGLPLLHSRDLVNWTLVNHALPVLGAPGSGIPAGHFDVPRHGGGVWAPSLRYHDGRYWIFYPDPDFGLFLVTATDPRGAWSAPILVKGGRGLIDPCPLWDDDGQAYLVHGWAKSRSGKNNLLTLNRLSADDSRVTDGEGVVIIDENRADRRFHTLEGPKLYKRGGTYWIFAPVGGVATGSQAVYRADDIRGPYEPRVVLAQGTTPTNGPHQGAWVDTPGGEHWFLHFQDRGPFGRVVHLQPMAWGRDGWPVLGTAAAIDAPVGEPVSVHAKPGGPDGALAAPATSDEFEQPRLGRQWQWQANPRPDWHSLAARPGWLRLAGAAPREGGAVAMSRYDAPRLLLQKFPAPAFSATTVLDFSRAELGDEAGLMVFGCSYAWIGLRRRAGGFSLVEAVNHDAHQGGVERDAAVAAVGSPQVELRVTVASDGTCRFSWRDGEGAFLDFGETFQATPGKWVGAKVGLFATAAAARPEAGFADFDFFRVTALAAAVRKSVRDGASS